MTNDENIQRHLLGTWQLGDDALKAYRQTDNPPFTLSMPDDDYFAPSLAVKVTFANGATNHVDISTAMNATLWGIWKRVTV